MKTRTSYELGLGLLLAMVALGGCARTVTLPAAELSTLSTCTATDEASMRERLNLESDCAFITVTSDITLTSGQLVLDKNVTITGPEGGNVTIDADRISRVFYVAADATVTLRNLTITGGSALESSGGGIFSEVATLTIENSTITGNDARFGGGIRSRLGTVTIRNSAISGNAGYTGGGLYSQGSTVMIATSTISGNRNTDPLRGYGGGILNTEGTLTLENTTVAGNGASTAGGGIFNTAINPGTLIITNSTIAGNAVTYWFPTYNHGGGIYNGGTLTIENSIVAHNTAINGRDVLGTFSGNHNLIGGTPGLELDDAGKPKLADNGGPTSTIALLADSPAMDTADGDRCPATDQRGAPRPQGAGCDIGAYEYDYPVFTGFASPVNDEPTLNTAKAGQTIPLKWHLEDVFGNPIADLEHVTVTVTSLACTAGTTQDAIEEYATGTSGLQNLGDGYYQYNWATPKTYARSCKTMHLALGDGISHTALFQFAK